MSPEPSRKPERPQRKRQRGVWGRLRALLRPQRPPDPSLAAVMAQWAEYELIFNDILQRLNAQLARQAKVEKKQLERAMREGGGDTDGQDATLPAPPILSDKQALRTRIAHERFGGRIQSILHDKGGNGVSVDQSS